MSTDYDIPAAHLPALMQAVALPFEDRYAILRAYFKASGGADPLWLFAQFIGLANAVAANARENAENLLVEMGDVHPYTADKINMPSVLGALGGVALAKMADQSSLCLGCAFRHGTVANTCLSTVSDAGSAQDDGYDFMCHIRGYENGHARAPCAGHVQVMKGVCA